MKGDAGKGRGAGKTGVSQALSQGNQGAMEGCEQVDIRSGQTERERLEAGGSGNLEGEKGTTNIHFKARH